VDCNIKVNSKQGESGSKQGQSVYNTYVTNRAIVQNGRMENGIFIKEARRQYKDALAG